MASETLTFDILAKDRASRTFDRIARSSEKTHKSLGVLSKGAKLLGGFFAAKIGVDMFTGFIDQAEEAKKVSASTARGIDTIGASSWTSVKAIQTLADTTSRKIGVDDELIQQSANLLLTFRNVQNAGQGVNAIFDRSVVAAQDLAAKGFGSADSAAKMLGKALNDPIKGLTALQRAGVTFSEAQKEQIKGFVEAGDVLSAQKIIMQEVEDQVGGTAEATATSTDKIKTAWGNVQESIGTKLLPALDSVATTISDEIVPAFTDFNTWLDTTSQNMLEKADDILAFADVLLTLDATILGFVQRGVNNFLTFGDIITTTFVKALGWVPGLGDKLREAEDDFETFKKGVQKSLGDAIDKTNTWDKTVDNMRKEIKLKGDINDLKTKLSEAKRKLKDPDLTKERKAKLNADIAELKRKINEAQAKIDALRGKTVHITVQTDIIGGQGVRIGERPRQHGGPVTAGRAYLVGERQAEVFVPNQSGRILPSVSRLPRAGGGDGAAAPTVVNVYLTNEGVLGNRREVEQWLEAAARKFAVTAARRADLMVRTA